MSSSSGRKNLNEKNIKEEYPEHHGEELSLARGRFQTALLDLMNKDELSESDNDSEPDQATKIIPMSPNSKSSAESPRGDSYYPSKPMRKRRRKDADSKEGFHHTFVMRMFDRSVDLAQFEESSSLYPICRAWMLNQPHNSGLNVKKEVEAPQSPSESSEEIDPEKLRESSSSPFPNIYQLPKPKALNEEETNISPRIPSPVSLSERTLKEINQETHISSSILLSEHLHKWRQVRNKWKVWSQKEDERYKKSYLVLKAMFER